MVDIIKVIFVGVVWALIMKLQIDFGQDQIATRTLKDGLEIAVHDAALMLDVEQLQSGFTVFNQPLAEQVFKKSFEMNLFVKQPMSAPLVGNFTPDEKSFFNDNVQILQVEYIDDATNPAGTYPCVYGISCGSGEYALPSTITGPSIVVVAETLSPRAFSKEKQVIRQAIIYEYKRN